MQIKLPRLAPYAGDGGGDWKLSHKFHLYIIITLFSTGKDYFKIDEDSGKLTWITAFTLKSECVIQDGNVLLPVTVSQVPTKV